MNKIFLRIIFVNWLISHVLAFVNPISVSGKWSEFSTPQIMFLIWVFIAGISGFYFIIYLFYHWHKTDFRKGWKVGWFLILLVGIAVKLYGPIIYYLIVYEWGKTKRFPVDTDKV